MHPTDRAPAAQHTACVHMMQSAVRIRPVGQVRPSDLQASSNNMSVQTDARQFVGFLLASRTHNPRAIVRRRRLPARGTRRPRARDATCAKVSCLKEDSELKLLW
jgi:hypothetical protein